MSTPVFYTKEQLLPQSQSPDQLSAWLSGKHPGYDVVAWCFYGNLVSEPKDGDKPDDPNKPAKPNVDAVAYVTQFSQSPNAPQLEGIGVRHFQSGFMYNGESTNGYLLSGDQSDTPIPAVAVTPKPWSIVMNFMEQSTSCVSVINGEFGSVSAEYMLTADVACLEGDFKRLRAEITMVDKMGWSWTV